MNLADRRVLGVDHGINHTGWGVVIPSGDGTQLSAVAFGTIETTPNQPFHLRLQKIYQELTAVIATYQPQELAVEKAIYAQNIKTALMMGHARGTVLLAAANAGLPIFEYSPKKIKSAVVGNGSATKEQVQFMVKRLLNINDVPPQSCLGGTTGESLTLDISDALAVAICHLNQPRLDEKGH